ncbi:MAG TPA: hypothetical protein PLW48_09745 [Alphaproteobacteria bacterium]|nr:hypothetical protein [Rhodospirillaceae bacterium]HRJ67407.1 hypothetical protein [Alphaproteobacteria bacterium]
MRPIKTNLLRPRCARPKLAADTLRLTLAVLTFVFAVFTVGAQAHAAAPENVRHEFVAGRNIILPALPGYEEVLGRSAEFDQLMSKFVLPDNRMLGFYISDADMARMAEGTGEGFRRYLIVQTVKQAVFLDGGADFEKIKAAFREEMKNIQPQELSEVGEVMREATKYIGSTYNTDMKMNVGENSNQGVFAEGADYIGFLNLSRLAIETVQGKKDYPAAVAMMAVNVRGRLILVYSYHSNYELLSDLDLVKKTAQVYADLLLQKNAGADGNAVIRNILLICLLVAAALVAGWLILNRLQARKQDKAV